MNYHPIMGISFFLICLILAYLLGNFISKKYKSSSSLRKKVDNSKGDAAMPDAPWVDQKNKN